MVLEYFGCSKSENELARASGATRRWGVEVAGLIKVAKKYGFKTLTKDKADFKDLRYWLDKKIPVIVEWFNEEVHFSVVVGLDRRHIYLMDPNLGQVRKIKRMIFLGAWFQFHGDFMKTTRDLHLRRMLVVYSPS